MNRHVRNAHQDLRNHKCDHCEKAFHNKQRLERHINSQHTKSRLWPCPVCHSKYDRSATLLERVLYHIVWFHSSKPDFVLLSVIKALSSFRPHFPSFKVSFLKNYLRFHSRCFLFYFIFFLGKTTCVLTSGRITVV